MNTKWDQEMETAAFRSSQPIVHGLERSAMTKTQLQNAVKSCGFFSDLVAPILYGPLLDKRPSLITDTSFPVNKRVNI